MEKQSRPPSGTMSRSATPFAICITTTRPALNPRLWRTLMPAPPYFPDVITLDRAVTSHQVGTLLADTGGRSVKDSYAVLDLAPFGFSPLFSASWIRRERSRLNLPPSWRGARLSRVASLNSGGRSMAPPVRSPRNCFRIRGSRCFWVEMRAEVEPDSSPTDPMMSWVSRMSLPPICRWIRFGGR